MNNNPLKFKGKIHLIRQIFYSFLCVALSHTMEPLNITEQPRDASWQPFIGLDATMPTLKPVTIAVVESTYDVDAVRDDFEVAYISPLVKPKHYSAQENRLIHRPIKTYDVQFSIRDGTDIHHYIELARGTRNSWLANKVIRKLEEVAEEVLFAEPGLRSEFCTVSSKKRMIVRCRVGYNPTEDRHLEITSGAIVDEPLFLSQARNLMLEAERAHGFEEKTGVEHSRSVLKALKSTFPGRGLRLKLYHPSELAAIAADPEVQIVNCSTHCLPQQDDPQPISADTQTDKIYYRDYGVFNGSGKIVVIAAGNGHLQLIGEDKTGLTDIINDANGYYPILASASCVYGEGFLGNCGDYLLKGQIGSDYPYMTAPGFFVDFLEDEPLFGCSIAAPFIAGGVARLKAALPDRPLNQLHEILIKAGRKPVDSISIPEIQKEDKLEFLLVLQKELAGNSWGKEFNLGEFTDLGTQSSEDQVGQAYDTVLTRIRHSQQLYPLEFLSKAIKNPRLRYHIWEAFDEYKYYNHLDIAAAYALTQEK